MPSIFVSLADTAPQLDLWWLSVHGIYRPCITMRKAPLTLLPQTPASEVREDGEPEDLLHPQYQLPSSCFAYIGDPAHPNVEAPLPWKSLRNDQLEVLIIVGREVCTCGMHLDLESIGCFISEAYRSIGGGKRKGSDLSWSCKCSFSFGKDGFMSHYTLPDALLDRWFAEFEFLPGIRNLAASGPFAVTTQELLALEGAETTARYLALGLDYVENPGNERLRQAIADLYTTLEAGEIRSTSGASAALILLYWTMLQPGDNILVEDPSFANIAGVAQSRGAEVRPFPLRLDHGWKADLAQMSHLVDH